MSQWIIPDYFFPQLQRDKSFGTDENAFEGMFTSAASGLIFISISRNRSVTKYLSHFRIHTPYRCSYFFSNGKSSLFSFYKPPILYDKKPGRNPPEINQDILFMLSKMQYNVLLRVY